MRQGHQHRKPPNNFFENKGCLEEECSVTRQLLLAARNILLLSRLHAPGTATPSAVRWIAVPNLLPWALSCGLDSETSMSEPPTSCQGPWNRSQLLSRACPRVGHAGYDDRLRHQKDTTCQPLTEGTLEHDRMHACRRSRPMRRDLLFEASRLTNKQDCTPDPCISVHPQVQSPGTTSTLNIERTLPSAAGRSL